MKKYVNINDNYSSKLRDEVDTSNNLRGEVDIIVKNKTTGEIEAQHNHNLIVYGGREWIIKKIFGSQLGNVDTSLLNSEICWFGVGNGGGEPGNPLQCGCTYGSDEDLYNPIRMKYTSDENVEENNNYYSSRIMPNGDTEYGYYKRITNIAIKEDHANPYKKNGVVQYPNLIVETRLEISSDDCCGQSYLNREYTKSYADINEAALFIADRTLQDPGKSAKVSSVSYDYYNYDIKQNRVLMPKNVKLPSYTKQSNKFVWEGDKPFVDTNIQYYDFYVKTKLESATSNSVKINGEYYSLDKKINELPQMLGLESDNNLGSNGYIELTSDKKIKYHFVTSNKTSDGEFTIKNQYRTDITSIDDILVLTHDTIKISITKDTSLNIQDYGEDKKIFTTFYYRSGYNTAKKVLRPQDSIFETSNSCRLYFPLGYTFDDQLNLIKSDDFNNDCVITAKEYIDLTSTIEIISIVPDANSYNVKLYLKNKEDIKNIQELQKIYFTSEIPQEENRISAENPATVLAVYDPENDEDVDATMEYPYITIERQNMVKANYLTNPITAKCYEDVSEKPYKMFNRVTFSTIRLNQNREVLIVWKLYF